MHKYMCMQYACIYIACICIEVYIHTLTHDRNKRTNPQPTNEHTNEQNGQQLNDRFTVEDAVAAPKPQYGR